MKTYFGVNHSIRIVINVGGFSIDQFLKRDEKLACYDRLEKSLSKIELVGVELLPQTMPPFPWHFGGQRFHNLFVEQDEIIKFCEKNNLKICLDISHSKLACSHFKTSFFKFCEKVAPFASHLHLADSKGKMVKVYKLRKEKLILKHSHLHLIRYALVHRLSLKFGKAMKMMVQDFGKL